MLLSKSILFSLLLILQGLIVNFSYASGKKTTSKSIAITHCSKDSLKNKTHSCCKKQKEKPKCCDQNSSTYACCCFTTFFVAIDSLTSVEEQPQLYNYKKGVVFSKTHLYAYQYLFDIEEPPEFEIKFS